MSTEENCTYFRHFTPGQDAEIFEYKTQKGEFLHQVILILRISDEQGINQRVKTVDMVEIGFGNITVGVIVALEDDHDRVQIPGRCKCHCKKY